MLKRLVIGGCMAWLLGGTTYAADEQSGAMQCTEELTKAEELVNDKIDANAISEDDAEKVDELLDQADADCTAGNFKDASTTLDTVNSIVAKAK
jgi:hypothetical protein